MLEYIDHSLFQATPLIFATLIDPVLDANDHMSKLIITKAERKKLLAELNSYFGKKDGYGSAELGRLIGDCIEGLSSQGLHRF
jgi:hypothetical protein